MYILIRTYTFKKNYILLNLFVYCNLNKEKKNKIVYTYTHARYLSFLLYNTHIQKNINITIRNCE